MPTAQTLINGALTLLGELTPGQTPNATESAAALTRLNSLIDNWNIQDKMATAATQQTASLTNGVASVALGTRVCRVVSASVVMAAGPTLPLRIVTAEEWNQIEDKDSSSNKVEALFYDRGFPTGTVYVAPRPLSNLSLTLVGWANQSTFASLATNNTLLPGYDRALTAALAMELAPYYMREGSGNLLRSYEEAMGEIRRLNATLWGALPAEAA